MQGFFVKPLQNNNSSLYLANISDAVQQNVSENTADEIVVLPANKPEVNAKSAISIESNLQDQSKVIFEKDSNLQLPIASLTKLMTAIVVLENYNLSDLVIVSKIADSQDVVKQDVKIGDKLSVEGFLDIMLIESSNKSAYALSELIGEEKFVMMMNKKAKDLGLKNTFFADPTGLSAQNVSTANDLAKLAETILKNYPEIARISKAKTFYIKGFGQVENTDQLLSEVPDIVCSKTGFTNEAKGCLLLVINSQRDNNYKINIILGADDRFLEMKKIINWLDANYQCQ